jgi:lipopolysaccharide/colanic/teichoic acid biosynthesis glycosyltransferase
LTGATGVLVVTSALTGCQVDGVVRAAAAARLHVQVWPGVRGVGSRRLRAVPISGEASFYVETRPWSRVDAAVKRTIDVVVSSLTLVATAPVLLMAAVLIKLQDGGPVVLRQQRVGRHGIPFTLYKLRTMVPHAEIMLSELTSLNERTHGPLFKVQADPRVTPVGRVLRATSIDELPQLLNVLGGSMSLVGPRPALCEEVARFDQEALRRLEVLPGVTGLWQVEARDNPSFHAYRRLDLSYVDNRSTGLDVAILLATGPVIAEHAARALARALRGRAFARQVR